MSQMSMVSMKAAMNLIDNLMASGAKLTWWVLPFILFAGSIALLPYNDWRAMALGTVCH